MLSSGLVSDSMPLLFLKLSGDMILTEYIIVSNTFCDTYGGEAYIVMNIELFCFLHVCWLQIAYRESYSLFFCSRSL